MTRLRKRQFLPLSDALEGRCLLSGTPAAVWVGQDGHDLAGGATPLAGNGIQDVHISLSGLPADAPITAIQMLGYGRGEWDLNVAAYSQYGGVLQQAAGATTADYYVDAYENETGRSFTLTITFADKTTAVITMNGGLADTNLHMPSSTVAALWLGQDGRDLTGPGVGVGPDGVQDVHLSLGHLDAATAVSRVTVTDTLGDAWGSGTNPDGLARAEFVGNTNDATLGDLSFNPTRDLNGQTLSVAVLYADGKLDHATLTAGDNDPTLAAPAPAPPAVNWNTVSARWVGQDGLNLTGRGDVHLALGSLPAGRPVVAATLSDQSGADWSYTRPGSNASPADPSAMTLGFQEGVSPNEANLGFQPVVDETGATLTLLLTLDDGSVLATRLSGGACDPGLRAPGIATTSVVAHPGDDLNALANRYGTVRLSAGLYPLNQPLVLNHPVTITADPGSTLLFTQSANAPAWAAAIKVRSSHTTLDGFAVRFAGPVRWAADVSYGPAVIGWSDNFDPRSSDPGVALSFTRSPASTSRPRPPRPPGKKPRAPSASSAPGAVGWPIIGSRGAPPN
ncbi:MAG: hypothetical protein LC745_03260 [Planctomycetia bacterium]|nr:hypothetical protein [Planctomycetia bacterium]